jgi:anti-anti-sigma factor
MTGPLGRLTLERDGDNVVAALEGEIDPSNARRLAAELLAGIPHEAMGVILDVSAVSFLDSSGVHLIFELAERLTGRQQSLVLVVPPDSPARRVLEIVALDQTAPLTPTRADAEAFLANA